MGRRLRYVPEGGALFEVTNRTIQGRLLFRPGRRLNEIAIGVLGRAQRRYGVSIVAFVLASNHYHMLVRVKDARQLSRFMQYFNGNFAREVARLTGWKDKIFSRRYQAILVSDEEAAQVERLKCILEPRGQRESGRAHQGLARSPQRASPDRGRGPSSSIRSPAGATSRSRSNAAGPPPWSRRIEEEARVRREAAGRQPLGVAAVLTQDPTRRPEKLKKSPAPFVHAATKAMRRHLWEAYAWFEAAYRDAAEKLRAGDPDPTFPPGCFPPALPFVGA